MSSVSYYILYPRFGMILQMLPNINDPNNFQKVAEKNKRTLQIALTDLTNSNEKSEDNDR